MNYPEYVKVNDKKYKINTDFRVAIECDKIARDKEISDYERALAIIYKLFGDEGLNNSNDWEKLLELANRYISVNNINETEVEEKDIDMDFQQDMDYIKASFMSDYNIDLDSKEMHWWTFYNLLNGLSNSEFGNCCILNRVRNLRNYDTSQIKDSKTRTKIENAKREVALKKKQKPLTEKQKASIEKFNKLAGIS